MVDGGGRYCEWVSLDISVRVHPGGGSSGAAAGELLIIAVNTAAVPVYNVLFDLSALTENILNRNGTVIADEHRNRTRGRPGPGGGTSAGAPAFFTDLYGRRRPASYRLPLVAGSGGRCSFIDPASFGPFGVHYFRVVADGDRCAATDEEPSIAGAAGGAYCD
eukprot:SAG22_NODE_3202_length_1860_cov_1.030097_2_plen_163_part_00